MVLLEIMLIPFLEPQCLTTKRFTKWETLGEQRDTQEILMMENLQMLRRPHSEIQLLVMVNSLWLKKNSQRSSNGESELLTTVIGIISQDSKPSGLETNPSDYQSTNIKSPTQLNKMSKSVLQATKKECTNATMIHLQKETCCSSDCIKWKVLDWSSRLTNSMKATNGLIIGNPTELSWWITFLLENTFWSPPKMLIPAKTLVHFLSRFMVIPWQTKWPSLKETNDFNTDDKHKPSSE